jgi:hypothetical protein
VPKFSRAVPEKNCSVNRVRAKKGSGKAPINEPN